MAVDPNAPLDEPLDCNAARKQVSWILTHGVFEYWGHCKEELAKDGLDVSDALNVLRGGTIYEPAEQHSSGRWRYRVHTERICVVLHFDSRTELSVVTAWRKKGGRR